MAQGVVADLKQVLPSGEAEANVSVKTKERAVREEKLKEACADFESIFIYNMLQKMRSTVPKSGLLQEMRGKNTYNTMVDQKVAEDLAGRGGLGLQKMLYDQIVSTDRSFTEGN